MLTTDKKHKELVPHLASSFGLNSQCQINLDPIVLAVCCFIREERATAKQGVTAQELVEKGREWFPQRSIHSAKQEAERMSRFAKSYPKIFSFDAKSETITLKPQALLYGELDQSDESWYSIALLRLVAHDDALEAIEALDDIEVNYPTDRKQYESSNGRCLFINIFFLPFLKSVQRAYFALKDAGDAEDIKNGKDTEAVGALAVSLKATSLEA